MNVKRLTLNLILALISIFHVWAGPVKNGVATYTQPDGSTFTATIKGDEWTKIRTTPDGCVITRQDDGWWCYGLFNSSGEMESSGYAVGKDTPADILASSRFIPYDILSSRAKSRRATLKDNAFRLKGQTKGGTVPSVVKAIVILVQFEDIKFRHKKEDFLKMLNDSGYNGTGSAKDYFEAQFGDSMEFSFDVSDIITLNRPVKYYGENDKSGIDTRAAEMAHDACVMADKDINFSAYDHDGDGEVDNVYIFYAGHDESEYTENTELLWAHQYYIQAEGFQLICDGKKLNRYACSSELSRGYMTGIGSFCHEFGHTFGLMDLYDTDYDTDGGWAAGLWRSTALMDGGNYNNNSATPPYFNCIERELLGLSYPDTLEVGNTYTLEPVHRNGQYYLLETDTPDEYYLIECRSNEGWDKHIGGSGMLIYHIDKNDVEYDENTESYYSRWQMNTINAVQEHQCADLIEADRRSDLIQDTEVFGNIRGIFFPQDDAVNISTSSHPSFRYWSGSTPDIAIIGIHKDGENIRFSVVRNDEIPDVPNIKNADYTILPDAVIVRFESEKATPSSKAVLKWRESGTEAYETVHLTPYEEGKFAYKIEGLQSGNRTYETIIQFEDNGISGEPYKRSIMTKRKSDVTWPYLYITDNARAAATTGIPLHVVNASEAAAIEWTFNDSPLQQPDDWFFRPDRSGTLQVEIIWEDGSSDIIIKRIIL